jgi:hypothetical protein
MERNKRKRKSFCPGRLGRNLGPILPAAGPCALGAGGPRVFRFPRPKAAATFLFPAAVTAMRGPPASARLPRGVRRPGHRVVAPPRPSRRRHHLRGRSPPVLPFFPPPSEPPPFPNPRTPRAPSRSAAAALLLPRVRPPPSSADAVALRPHRLLPKPHCRLPR